MKMSLKSVKPFGWLIIALLFYIFVGNIAPDIKCDDHTNLFWIFGSGAGILLVIYLSTKQHTEGSHH
jgi:hypothetical protein